MSAPWWPNLVASTTLSRRPLRASPRASSEAPAPCRTCRPCRSRVMPSSMAASTTARVRALSRRPPKLLHPKPTTETSRPESPQGSIAHTRIIRKAISPAQARRATAGGPRAAAAGRSIARRAIAPCRRYCRMRPARVNSKYGIVKAPCRYPAGRDSGTKWHSSAVFHKRISRAAPSLRLAASAGPCGQRSSAVTGGPHVPCTHKYRAVHAQRHVRAAEARSRGGNARPHGRRPRPHQ